MLVSFKSSTYDYNYLEEAGRVSIHRQARSEIIQPVRRLATLKLFTGREAIPWVPSQTGSAERSGHEGSCVCMWIYHCALLVQLGTSTSY